MFTLVFLIAAGAFLLLIWLVTRKSDSSPGWLNPSISVKSLPSALGRTLGMKVSSFNATKIIFNGKHYSSVDEMPPDVRAAYEKTMGGLLVDANSNGVPDIMEDGGGHLFQTTFGLKSPEDPVDALGKLKEMKDAGLITEQEYESKKTEILSRL